MAVESTSEQQASRMAARATVVAFTAGSKAVHAGAWQREVELAVVDACWKAGARGVSFWPWAMAGANGVFPKPFESDTRYDHLDTTLRAGSTDAFGCRLRMGTLPRRFGTYDPGFRALHG